MHIRLLMLTAALMVGVTPAWATVLPAYETYSAAADFGTNFFSSNPTYTQLLDTTTAPGAIAQISGSGYMASASTTLGSNHAYASASSTPTNVLSAGSFSGWYDQVTITGGTGTGTAKFTVRLTGIVDVGAMAGRLSYTLGASSIHPSLLAENANIVDTAMPPTSPWSLQASSVTTITSYLIGASPYNDTSILFSNSPTPPPTLGSIPSIISDPLLGGDTGMGFPAFDLVLTPGMGQDINITLEGAFNFTYGEAFYLIGGLDASILGDGIEPFCPFSIGSDTCGWPPKDGNGATTLDFSHTADLIDIALPEGATATFASGSVPEPSSIALIGLGMLGMRLTGRRMRRKAA